MPTWIRKRLKMLKEEFLSHLGKNACQSKPSKKKRAAGPIEPNIRMIHNRLTTQRIRNKSEINAYRDYAKWPDGLPLNQNKYASYRHACNNKASSCDNETLSPATDSTADNKQTDNCRTVNKPVLVQPQHYDELCDSESELIEPFFFV